MNRFAVIAVCAALSAQGADLLQNPGFETRQGDLPAQWHVYVEPQEGSLAELDGAAAHEGQWSVRLHNALPYAEEPANNWSQNVLADLSEDTVVLSGWIKTEEAGEAALWIQCFRKDPWEVLLQESTGDTDSLSGSQPWTEVTVEADVPEGTDFIVVRCVLKGTGTAWFDDVSLEVKEKPASVSPAAEKPVVAPAAPTVPTMPKSPESPRVAPPTDTTTGDEIVAAHEAIREANEALRESNEALAAQLKAMQEQLKAMREQIREAGAIDSDDAESRSPVPPLIPHVPKQLDEDAR
ncbi:MAG: hypothetical protein AMXMBFR82_24650 [Candidatus Hydrogenedentota bacterium]